MAVPGDPLGLGLGLGLVQQRAGSPRWGTHAEGGVPPAARPQRRKSLCSLRRKPQQQQIKCPQLPGPRLLRGM